MLFATTLSFLLLLSCGPSHGGSELAEGHVARNKVFEATPTAGALRGLYTLVAFADNATAIPIGTIVSAISDQPDSVKNYFLETSYGKLNLEAAFQGPVSINTMSVGRCEPVLWDQLARDQLVAANVDPASFHINSFIFSNDGSTCGEGGVADGSTANMFARMHWNASDLSHGFFHENGHNLGFGHAHSMICQTRDLADPGCVFDEYGDFYDIMGRGTRSKSYSAMLRKRAGWLPDDDIVWLRTSGTYEITISAIEDPSDVLKAVFIQPASSSNPTVYTISFRTPSGNSDGMLPAPTGAIIQYDPVGNLQSPVLLMAKPESNQFDLSDGDVLSFGGLPFSVEQHGHMDGHLKLTVRVF